MNRIRKLLLATMLLIISMVAYSQTGEIAITSFEYNANDLKASVAAKYDRNGKVCAAIRFSVKDNHIEIKPSLYFVDKEKRRGEIILYVPEGTERLTIRFPGATPLYYTIPMEIESNVTYDAVIYISEELLNRRKANSGHVVYASAGYNIMSISGPSIAVGIDINRHNAEIGATLGLNKSDDIFFYGADGTLQAGYNYKAFRAYARYGYDFPLSDFFCLTPQAGVTLNSISGTAIDDINIINTNMKSATTMSGLAALRLTISLNDRLKIHLTPEYDFGIVKDNNFKTISEHDNTIKSWTDGFNLNASLAYFF